MPIEINIPGSKSIANRLLLIKALSKSNTTIHNLPDCDDVRYMQAALEELQKDEPKIYTGNAGTTTRFLTAYCTTLDKHIQIDGDERMRERPIQVLVDALNSLGADISSTNGCPPLHISPAQIKSDSINLPGNISSQYLSALLMLAAFSNEEIQINIEQELCSKPYVNITLELLKKWGITIENNNFAQFVIKPQSYQAPSEITVEFDASSASYIGAYAALHPEKDIQINNLSRNSIQGDIKFLELLEKMGCKITEVNNAVQIKGPQQLQSLNTIDMNSIPDLVMTFAVLALFCKDPTHITNVANLRIKETDRLAALENELKKLNAQVQTTEDSISITPPSEFPTTPIEINTYEDHRMAMCFGILQDLIPNISIENPNCVSKSYTTFWEDLKKLQS